MLLTSPLSTDLKSDALQEQQRRPALESALVILDPKVDDLSQLRADLLTQDVLVLDPAIDGIEQITVALQSRQSISSLHIISHGSPGCLEIGSTRLTLENLAQYSDSLQTWSKVLSGQDLLLYGCQVAKGALGYLFLRQLHQLTKANLAASVERVGRVDSHQNWTLETQVGQVKTQPIFSPQLQQSYIGHFETVNFSLSTDTVIESEGTPFSFNFTVDGPIPAGGSIVRLEGSIPQAINQWDLFQLDFSGLAGGFGVGIIDVSPNQDFSAFDVVITEPNASISLPVFNDFQDDSPQEVTWTVTPVSAGTTVNNSSATVTIFDDPSEVPSQPSPTPELSLTSDITTLVEDEGTEVTFTISLSEPPPENGLIVGIGTGKPFALGDFDVFPPPPQASATGGQLVAGFPDNSGFNFRVTSQTATVTLPIFDDQDRVEDGSVTDPDGPLRNDDIGEEQTTFSILPGEGYTINSNESSVTLTLLDTQAIPNTPPEAENDSYSTDFETALTVNASNGVLNNDTDADGDSLSVAVATDPTNGSVSLNTDGSFTYTPNEGFSGSDTFTYTVIDGNEGSDTATVTVTVEEAPPPPTPLTVGISATPTSLVEEAGTVTTLTFTLSEAPPEGGVQVSIDSDIQAALAEFDVAAANFSGAQLVSSNADSSGFTVNITEQTATISLPVFDDEIDEGIEEITFTLQASDAYEIADDAASITLSIEDDDGVEPPMNTPPVADGDSYSTTAGTPLIVEAENGVLINDTDADGDSLVVETVGNPSNGTVQLNEDGSFTYTPNAGFVGTDSFTYQASDGTDTSEVTTVSITVESDAPPPPGDDEPVVSFSTTPEVISEAEGTALVMNFSVEGDIPEEGITVNLEGDAARIMQEFTVAQTRFDAETGNIFYRFDNGFVDPANGFVVGGILDRFSLEDGDPAENNADPAAAADSFLSDFSFTITEANASITIPVLDDIIEEPDQTFTYTLVDGDGYAVDATANSGTFTVTDGVPGGVGPTVGVTASPTTLIESEQTVIEVTFTTEGEIPADGLVVQFQGPPRAIAEFDVNATNPRLPEDETEVQGVAVSGGNIVGTDEVAGSLFFRINDPTATITVPVFQDDVAEGTEVLPFTLLDGELYEVDPTASAVTITIEDDAPDDGDVIEGTDANDILIGDESDNTIEALGGNDTVAGDLGNDIIMGGDGEDILRGDLNSRSPQDDVMGGDDIIFGGEGNDRIGGKSGNDILSGDAGDDQIWGDDGDDILMGVTGNDILVGDNFSDGSGSDLFVFGNGDGTDTILDFEVGTDRIGLVEGELVFSDITLTQDGSNTLMGVASTGEILAVLNNVQASVLSEDSFAIVPDVSNPEEALQII